jgi:hypothetical protein
MKITAAFLSIPSSSTGEAPPPPSSAANASLMAEPPENQLLCSGDPGAMIAALEVITAKEEMKSAHDARNVAGALEDAADQKKLDDMKSQADAKEWAGIAEGVGGVAQGGLDMGGAASTSPTTREELKGGGDAANGIGKLFAAYFTTESSSAERSKESDEIASKHAKQAWDGFNDDIKDFRELMTAAIKFYGDWASQKVQSEQAAIHKT